VDLHETSVIIEVILFFIISIIEAAIELSSQDNARICRHGQQRPSSSISGEAKGAIDRDMNLVSMVSFFRNSQIVPVSGIGSDKESPGKSMNDN
jgi:hypothetical protein